MFVFGCNTYNNNGQSSQRLCNNNGDDDDDDAKGLQKIALLGIACILRRVMSVQ